jgi:hypothetical protein
MLIKIVSPSKSSMGSWVHPYGIPIISVARVTKIGGAAYIGGNFQPI